jgi:hypothetical protein
MRMGMQDMARSQVAQPDRFHRIWTYLGRVDFAPEHRRPIILFSKRLSPLGDTNFDYNSETAGHLYDMACINVAITYSAIDPRTLYGLAEVAIHQSFPHLPHCSGDDETLHQFLFTS